MGDEGGWGNNYLLFFSNNDILCMIEDFLILFFHRFQSFLPFLEFSPFSFPPSPNPGLENSHVDLSVEVDWIRKRKGAGGPSLFLLLTKADVSCFFFF